MHRQHMQDRAVDQGPTSASHIFPAASPEQVGLSSAGLDRLTTAMQSEVDANRVPGVSMLIARGGKLAYRRDVGALRPGGPALKGDAIFRIFSMTKPIASVALMMLVEEGRLFISDHLAKFLPEFANMKVGVEFGRQVRPDRGQQGDHHPGFASSHLRSDLRIHRQFGRAAPLSQFPICLRRIHHTRTQLVSDLTTAEFITALAKLPLIDQPGAVWNYSHSTDVIGRVIEVVSGQSLGAFFQERILTPLGMHDTFFLVPPDKHERVAEPFNRDPDTGKPVQLIEKETRQRFELAGGGLWSTMDDYTRFVRMLYLGGTLDGTRIIGRKTLAFMASDHLGPNVRNGTPALLAPGHGFGLGFCVRLVPGMASTPGTPGEFYWGGLAGTAFWIAPQEELVAMMMIQGPGQRDYYRQMFRNMVHAALI